jgi:hypothetical protein
VVDPEYGRAVTGDPCHVLHPHGAAGAQRHDLDSGYQPEHVGEPGGTLLLEVLAGKEVATAYLLAFVEAFQRARVDSQRLYPRLRDGE